MILPLGQMHLGFAGTQKPAKIPQSIPYQANKSHQMAKIKNAEENS
jgi:hypothetical protein